MNDHAMRKRRLLIVICCLSVLPVIGHAQLQQSAAFDTSRMQRDLEIMEAILDRLFDSSTPYYRFGGDGSRGLYLPGYGVFFQVPRNELSIHVFAETLEQALGMGAPLPAGAKPQSAAGSRVTVRQRAGDSPRRAARTELQTFFANYADAIGQIDNHERIAVYIAGGSGFVFTPPGITTFPMRDSSKEVLAAVRKADIVARRNGKLEEEDFNRRMLYREVRPRDEDTDLEVMARIVDTALRSGRQRHGRIDADTRTLYVEGLGALFLVRASFGNHDILEIMQAPPAPDTDELKNLERRVIELQTASQRTRSNWRAEYNNLRQRLAEILADYGHTLRQLQRDDWIVIAADLRGAAAGSPRELLCRVQKQAIDAYNNRSITRDQLLNKIDYFEY